MTILQKPFVGQSLPVETMPETIPNGPGAAAILAAGIGCATIGILALAGDASKAINSLLNFYNPSGALSGVTTVAIIVWLVAWFILARRWEKKTVAMSRVNIAAFALLLVGVLLTFPPFMDFLQGR
ncbi:hypothetical protein P9272_29530 [Mesorhizobium sp. WSM4976]|uniref:hypothetical protein n=1 Tax=Mesorhizobium sp. WSM4976 TaxID=3038549 RepID=UPI002416D67B|nr:hypothetical protein [Mesorhizobium sp. WSM4976]MDG4897685.1 hypothetical protein [Mesorhizobium sp. WSM4976]